MFEKIKNSVKKNKERIFNIAVAGGSTILLLSVEFAGELKLIDKICKDCDEDNPANFLQLLGTTATLVGGTGVQYVTALAGIGLIVDEIDDWESAED